MRKQSLTILLIALFTCGMAYSQQVVYFQYRTVPADREREFVEKETHYWAKAAKAAIDQGHMRGWSLWRKVGVTGAGEPNYIIANIYESPEKFDPSKIWNSENLEKMGVSPEMVETNSFAPVAFDYYFQLEDMIPGDNTLVVVNYAMPNNLRQFIEENKSLWKPLHQKSINSGTDGMISWGIMSVIMPKGQDMRFSAITWDGFNTMKDVMNYLRYRNEPLNADWQNVLSKTKMAEIMPRGFTRTVVYQRVAEMNPE